MQSLIHAVSSLDESTPDSIAAGVFLKQARALEHAATTIGPEFAQAIDLILGCSGRVIVIGVGKSGLIGKKIAATLASTGTPSFFVHPVEAFHGDLGMIAAEDVIILISFSGETDEVTRLVPFLRRFGNRIISLIGRAESTLARHSDIALLTPADRESCPNNLAPTTSTTVTLAMGDALAVALMKSRGFKPERFAAFHPGGSLGRRLLTRVKDVMHAGKLPVVKPDRLLRDCLWEMTRARLGLVLVLDGSRAIGIVTDGDLRRALLADPQAMSSPIANVMSRQPVTIHEEEKLADAEMIMRERKIKVLVVVNDEGATTGLLEIFD
ncbi:KpsF/GutQ family sugar-phosphate isomerase [Nitrococcus mobilis]|uniref:Arabinose 5-phosphate isomerase n=1 Tax=Nitrococcus mobilis Nb-231 TaxID=314278 RepID=A4BRU8_9GAMM|nr:KpsF/GutQ family sugar-phosphate isomerase [Nitrococcus mobilis]EAR21669.1 KpsF/GutQ family protein [Nitrococcus mobilis Nb-231]